MTLRKIVELDGGSVLGQNVYCIMAAMREMAQAEHCVCRMLINGKTVTVDEFEPFWSIVKQYDGS